MEMQITVTVEAEHWHEAGPALAKFALGLNKGGPNWRENYYNLLDAVVGANIGEIHVEPLHDPDTVAVVYDRHTGEYIDECYAWQAGQSYALHNGHRVEAVADDGRMDVDTAQSLYDSEQALYIDCWE